MNNYMALFMFWSGVACWCYVLLRCGFACSRAYATRRLREDALSTLRSVDFDSCEHEANGQIQGQIAQGQP